MSNFENFSSSNRLLAALSESDRELLYPHLETVELGVKEDVEVRNAPIENVYFPERGMISTVSGIEGEQVEVGLTGREGVSGVPILLGADSSPNHAYAQIAGQARRINADDFRNVVGQSDSLRSMLLRYVQVFLIQANQTALANARFKIEERLGRKQDATHTYALALAARRPPSETRLRLARLLGGDGRIGFEGRAIGCGILLTLSPQSPLTRFHDGCGGLLGGEGEIFLGAANS